MTDIARYIASKLRLRATLYYEIDGVTDRFLKVEVIGVPGNSSTINFSYVVTKVAQVPSPGFSSSDEHLLSSIYQRSVTLNDVEIPLQVFLDEIKQDIQSKITDITIGEIIAFDNSVTNPYV